MKGAKYMENKIVTLKETDGLDILEFDINDGTVLTININSNDQKDLRKLFYQVIKEAMKAEFQFELKVEDGYKKQLYIEVSTEYIKQLNAELSKIIEDIPEELKS